ncbi:MAG: HlyD family efflux transporter periplasmic adaptor subunit [Chloroflexi bacterium]|nr:HlyD family efflux transporter periplasmic adaptor subunit [Chloroflexota bacterium]
MALDEAQNALDNLLQRPGINVAGAQLAVAQSEIALDNAREQLDDLLEPQQILISGLEARVAAAKVELDAAQEAYDDIKDGNFPEEVLRDARNGVSFTTTALEAATRGSNDAQTAAQNALMQAEDAEYVIREQYSSLFKFWFGTELTDAELEMTADEVLAEWGIDLEATFERLNPQYASIEPTPDDPDTRWNELTIWAWLNLSVDYPAIIPTCTDEDAIARNKRCITRELQNTYDAYDRVRDGLEAVRNNAATTAEQTEDAVAAAEAALSDAQDALEELEDGPDSSLVESAEKRLQLAMASLQEAEDDLAELTVDIDPLNVSLARAAVAQAEVGLQEANDTLERARDDRLYIESAGKRLDLASAALRSAETNLNVVQELIRDQVAAAEAELALAVATLDKTQEAHDGAVITSPMDGIVSLVNIEVDDPVGDEMTALSVVAPDVVEIDGVIDAAGRPYVSEGASALVNIESVGDTALGGSVSYIGSEARTERGVISYAVRIRVEVPPGINVPVSISAASAVIEGSDTALLNGGTSEVEAKGNSALALFSPSAFARRINL